MAYQEYLCEGYTNVYIVRDDTRTAATATFHVHPESKAFIDALVAARPRWVFKSSRSNPLDKITTIAARSFDVFQDGVRVGDITTTTTHRTGDPMTDYCWDNDRLQAKRLRGAWSKSTKMDVAVKNILKAFYAKTSEETIHEKEAALYTRLSRNAYDVGHTYNQKIKLLQPNLTKFLMDNWAELTPRLREAGADVDDALPKLFQEWTELEYVTAAYNTDKGCTIHVRGSDYIVVRGRGEERQVEVKASEELPEIVRRNLGLLKLSEIGITVPNIGLRESDSTFFVMDRIDND